SEKEPLKSVVAEIKNSLPRVATAPFYPASDALLCACAGRQTHILTGAGQIEHVAPRSIALNARAAVERAVEAIAGILRPVVEWIERCPIACRRDRINSHRVGRFSVNGIGRCEENFVIPIGRRGASRSNVESSSGHTAQGP